MVISNYLPKTFSLEPEVQAVIDWVSSHNLPALPVAPKQSARKYPKVIKGDTTKQTWENCPLDQKIDPIPLFTGKNPSYLDQNGIPHLINHSQYQLKLPTDTELRKWFDNPINGIGTLGGHGGYVWLDFDIKQFDSEFECSKAVKTWLESHPKLKNTLCERTHSGGWRFGVRVNQKPKFTNFAFTPDGNHIGEALGEGRFTVLAPTVGVTGNSYKSLNRTTPVEIDSLESIGIYPSGKSKEKPLQKVERCLSAISSCIPLDMLLTEQAKEILNGANLTGDRSEALATLIREAYGWENWARDNNVSIGGNTETLAYTAGAALGIDSGRVERIKKGIEPDNCQPAAAYRDDHKSSCWLKIRRLDKATYEARCPQTIKNTIAQQSHSKNGKIFSIEDSQSDTSKQKQNFEAVYLREPILEILNSDLTKSRQKAALLELAKANNYNPNEIQKLANLIQSENEQTEERQEIEKALPSLLKLQKQRLNPHDYLWGDRGILAQQLTEIADAMPTSVDFLLTTLISVAGSRIGTAARIIINARSKYVQPAIYRTCIVAPSGFKKTPAQLVIINPLNDLEAEEYKRWSAANEAYKQDKSEYDRKIRQAGDNIGEPPKTPPPRKRFILSDATIEARCAVQAENPRGFLLYKDEWTAHITSRAVYKSGKGDEREAELTEFNGGSLSKDRATNNQSTYIERTAISRTGSTQPETLRSYMGDHEDPTGEFARWLFCVVDSPPAYIDLVSAGDDNGVDQSLQSLYKNLGLQPNKDYFLSDEAKVVFQDYQHKIIDWTLEEKHPGLKTAYAKFESYFARLALWLHCVNAALAGTIPEQAISKETMIKAVTMTSYFIGQLRIIYALNAPHVSLTGRLLKIKEYINNKPKGVTPRQIKSGLWFVRKVSTADIAQDCKTLDSSGCICLQDGRYYPAKGVDNCSSHPQHPYST